MFSIKNKLQLVFSGKTIKVILNLPIKVSNSIFILFFSFYSFASQSLTGEQHNPTAEQINLNSNVRNLDCDIQTFEKLRNVPHGQDMIVQNDTLRECRALSALKRMTKLDNKTLPATEGMTYLLQANSVDITPPEFKGIEFSTNNVDVTTGEQTITIKVYVYEAQSQPGRLSIELQAPTGTPSSHQKLIRFDSYSNADWQPTDTAGVYSLERTARFDNSYVSGTWNVSIGTISDAQNNYSYEGISTAQLSKLGYNPYIHITNPHAVDVTPPEFRGIEFSNHEIDVSSGKQTVTIKAYVYDEQSKPRLLWASLYPPEGVNYVKQRSLNFHEYWGTGWIATELKGVYSHELTVTFDESDGAGIWYMNITSAYDANGNINDLALSESDLVKLGHNPYIKIINSNQIDNTAPEFRSIEFSTNEIDLSRGQSTISVKIAVYDAHSQPADMGVNLIPPSGVPDSHRKGVRFSRNSWQPTDTDGLFTNEGTATFSHLDANGAWSTEITYIMDINENFMPGVSTSQLANLGFDPLIKVNISEKDVNDLMLSVENNTNDPITHSNSAIFKVANKNFLSVPTRIVFNFNLSEGLRDTSLSISGVSVSTQACSIRDQIGKCDIVLPTDWETAFLTLTYASESNQELSISGTVESRFAESNFDNNKAVYRIAAGINNDINGDGTADVLWRNSQQSRNLLWVMDGTSVLQNKELSAVDDAWDIAGQGDFNADGTSDILWRNNKTGRNYIWLMEGGALSKHQAVNTLADLSWQVKAVADFNGDNRSDILWHHQQTGLTAIYLMDGWHIQARETVKLVDDLNWSVGAAADVNADGKTDLIWRNSATGENHIWLMNGTNIENEHVLNIVSTEWELAGTGDLNSDGTDDIIWRNSLNGRNWAYLMLDSKIETSALINTVNSLDWKIKSIADFNGDKKADIFWHNQHTNQTYIYFMDGTQVATSIELDRMNSAWQAVGK
ncbi:VCBS repeat-containing protein [Pseudoalteromonas sp. MMG005]|uniref:FG-GAP repeat domain-containing protein n=1 Tax=Pseudoalteromonas sp. MMG005 TaxID=2822682 RepID=UPI001B39D910|nr:VCBS repeat-containing protein [Pseudoalteromonas sp. MMG005]MBQ4846870.1 VCBS repeat-containing protein [Pseudoalteromonas sp. MMG005]